MTELSPAAAVAGPDREEVAVLDVRLPGPEAIRAIMLEGSLHLIHGLCGESCWRAVYI